MLMPSIFGEDLFDQFFDDFGNRPERRKERGPQRTMMPVNGVMRTDIKESEGSYELHIDLPGCKKENVQAELKDGYLTITAKTQSEDEQKDEKERYIRRERYFGTFSRCFYVGEDVEQQDIKARFEDGILKLTIPKKEEKPQVEENHFIEIEG